MIIDDVVLFSLTFKMVILDTALVRVRLIMKFSHNKIVNLRNKKKMEFHILLVKVLKQTVFTQKNTE